MAIGCSKKMAPQEAYAALRQKKASSPFEAVPTIRLDLDKDYKFSLTDTDSVFLCDDSNQRYSYYKNFNIPLKSRTKYKLSISSLCDCAGFKKYMFIPVLLVTSNIDKKEVSKHQPELDSFDYRFGPLSMNFTYIINSESYSNYKIIVFSANQGLGEKVCSIPVIGLPNIDVKATVIGKFHIKIEEIKWNNTKT